MLQVRKSVQEMPRYKVAKHSKQFDSLMSLLVYGGIVSERALEVLKMLVTNPVLHSRVMSLDSSEGSQEFRWSEIFDETNVHKMIYSLEIVEAILLQKEDESQTADWVKRFVDLGGLQELQNKLQAAVDSVSTSQSNDKKKYVDQLLTLIRIFVVGSQAREEASHADEAQPQSEAPLENSKPEEKEIQFTTPQKPITRHLEAAGQQAGEAVSAFEITEELLFGEDTGHAAAEETKPSSAEEVNAQPVAENKGDPFDHLRRIISKEGIGELITRKIDLPRLR